MKQELKSITKKQWIILIVSLLIFALVTIIIPPIMTEYLMNLKLPNYVLPLFVGLSCGLAGVTCTIIQSCTSKRFNNNPTNDKGNDSNNNKPSNNTPFFMG